MKIGQQINFIVINKQANSLYSLIAYGQYRATLLGRNTWKRLISSQASLQYNCNKEGFDVGGTSSSNSKARIGMTATFVIPESGLVQEGILMISTRVETRHCFQQIMETKKLMPWATAWCVKSENLTHPRRRRRGRRLVKMCFYFAFIWNYPVCRQERH